MKPRIFSCITTALLMHFVLQAQTPFNKADTLAGHFISFLRADDREHIILQTDRKLYVAGEKLWFNAFLVRALNNKIDTLSKSLFADLTDDNDKVYNRLALNTVTLKTSGMFNLSDTLRSGYYWLRCYTKRMATEDTGNICLQPVYIFNARKPEAQTRAGETAQKENGPVIQIFPEGGTTITGINSVIAVKATDQDENPIEAPGYIINSKDSVVATFTTNKFGLARVAFYPIWFYKYTVVVKAGGRTLQQQLPPFNLFAGQIAVTAQDNNYIQARVTLEDSIFSRRFVTYLLGISGDSVCFVAVGRGNYETTLPVQNFPGGIATLLLFDEDKHLMSERKIFINKDNYTLQITTDKQNYAARDNASVVLTVTDATGRPLVAALNISVENDKIAKFSDEIGPDTLQPGNLGLNDWLLKSRNTISPADIDLIMLARLPGFKNWEDDSAKPSNTYNDNEVSLRYLRGKILNSRNIPVPGQVVTAISKTGRPPFLNVDTTNAAGGFQFPLPAYQDSLGLIIRITNRYGVAGEQYKILLDSFRFPACKTPSGLKQRFIGASASAAENLRNFHVDTVLTGTGNNWLKPIIVTTTEKRQENYDVNKRASIFSYIITSDKFTNVSAGTVVDKLLTVPGMHYKEHKLVLSSNDYEPLLVVDGVPMMPPMPFDTFGFASPLEEMLSTVNPRNIDFIEVLNGSDASIYGMAGGHGVIIINTKTNFGNDDNAENNGVKIISTVTYHITPPFIMPDYADKQVKKSKPPDQRNTIYWAGNLVTGPDGKAVVNFYTADDAATYTVIITGITAKGDYIYKRITLNRK